MAQIPSLKRPRPDDVLSEDGQDQPTEAQPANPYVDILRKLCLRRDTMARWCSSEVFDKVVRGKLIRIAAADGGYEVHLVVGLESASESYTIDFIASNRDIPEGQVLDSDASFVRLEKKKDNTGPRAPPGYDTYRVSTRAKVRTQALLKSPAVATAQGQQAKQDKSNAAQTPSTVPITSYRLSMVSNSPPSIEDLQTILGHVLLPDHETARRKGEDIERLLAEAAAQFATAVVPPGADPSAATLWGSKRSLSSRGPGHHVLLILRSWLAQDAVDDDNKVGVWAQEQGDSAAASSSAPPPSSSSGLSSPSSSFIPEIFRPCVTDVGDGRGVDDYGYGPGPLRTMERVVGQYRYAFQHRVAWTAPAGSTPVEGSVSAALASCGAAPLAGPGPASFLTPLAMAAAPSYDEHQPELTLWRCIRQYIDDGVSLALARDAIVAQLDLGRAHGPGSTPQGDGSEPGAGGAAGDARAAHSFITPSRQYVGHVLAGPVTAYIVDVDVLARGMTDAGTPTSTHGHERGGQAGAAGSGGDGAAAAAGGLAYSRLAHMAPARAWLRRVFGRQPNAVTAGQGGAAGGQTSASLGPAPQAATLTKCGHACENSRVARMLQDTSRKDTRPGSSCVYRDGTWPGTAGCVSLSPTGLLWLDEDTTEALVRGGSVDVTQTEGSPATVLSLHPAVSSVLLPFSVEDPSGQVEQDKPVPGTSLYEDGPLPDAYALSEALVQQNRSYVARPRLFASPKQQQTHQAASEAAAAAGSYVAGRAPIEVTSLEVKEAHKVEHWPPWPVYPLARQSAVLLAPATVEALAASSASSSSWTAPPTALRLHTAWCPHLFPHRNGRHNTLLYHGTSTDMAAKVKAEGFRRAVCRMVDRCYAGACDDQMLGFGVYFGDLGKASEYALKRAVFDPELEKAAGAVVVSRVDLGHVQCAPRSPCPCGCGQYYVDHYGSWYAEAGHDTLYLRDNSLPAARTREWAVADPARIVVAEVTQVIAEGTST